MLRINDVSVRYGRSVQALRGVTFEVPDRSVMAVLGSNGAGKSTLLRAISGTLRLHRGAITSGDITYDDTRIDGQDPAWVVRSGILQVPEGRQIFGRMSVDENLRAGGLTASASKRSAARDRVYGLFPRLAERSKLAGGLLSGGEQQMLAIGRALMSDPKLILLDEPSLGLAPQMVTRIGSIVADINATGTGVILVEQNATMALRVAQNAVVFEVGEVALQGEAADLAASEDVQRLYLGGHADTEVGASSHEARTRRTLGAWTG